MELRTSPIPNVTGGPGLAQGRYGERGNLELLVPAADGGCWVFWWNADGIERRAGAALGCWSGGLHVLGDERFTQARISQVSLGPDFLEAAALTAAGALTRWHWTPAHGFVCDGVVLDGVVATSAIVEADAALHLLVVTTAGGLVHLVAPVDGYPDVQWTSRLLFAGAHAVALSPELVAVVALENEVRVIEFADAAWRDLRRFAGRARDVAVAGRVALCLGGDGSFAGLSGDAITAASTTIDGGRIDVVLARHGGLVHLHGDGTTWSQAVPVESTVWSEPDAPIHRR